MVYSNFTPRASHLSNISDFNGKIVFFGLQHFIKKFLIENFNNHFFKTDKATVVAEYKTLMDQCLGLDMIPTDHIEALHDLGYLPLEIKGLPEGSLVPIKVPVLTVKNTKPEFFWLTNYIESVMSAYLWKMSVTATTARHYKKLCEKFAKETSGDLGVVPFQAHDFSFRGMSGVEDAAMSGAAHLTSFVGTDSVPAIKLLEKYYQADINDGLIGASVPATEHSVMCMGTKEAEVETFRRLTTELYPSGIVSIVSDTWDFWKVVTEYVTELKDEIMARDGKVVIRPDSGDPVKVICGSPYETYETIEKAIGYEKELVWNQASEACEGSYNDGGGEYTRIVKVGEDFFALVFEVICNRHDKQYYYVEEVEEQGAFPYTPTPAFKGAIQCLWEVFGGTEEGGYKQLDSHIGLIYGDSITYDRAKAIFEGLKKKGFSSTNVDLGVGSYTYQYVTRDTYGFAMKATAGVVNGELREIFKDPITDDGTKKSLRGLLRVDVDSEGELYARDQVSFEEERGGLLQIRFLDGKSMNETTLEKVRGNV